MHPSSELAQQIFAEQQAGTAPSMGIFLPFTFLSLIPKTIPTSYTVHTS